MENMEIIKIRLNGIMGCIKEYTSEPAIKAVLTALEEALKQNDFSIILFSCKEIESWYQKNISEILSNKFVFNSGVHKENRTTIQRIIEDLEAHQDEYKQELHQRKEAPSNKSVADDCVLCNIFNKFHAVVVQLHDRYAERETLDVDDEYDVQDLLHALLRLYFDDIRPEEWTPSYAGTASRQDFLLKNESTVIETKKTRKGLNNKELANELIIDIERYSVHPDCKQLICFVYDPENRIKNPRGFEKDLSYKRNDMNVQVFIRP